MVTLLRAISITFHHTHFSVSETHITITSYNKHKTEMKSAWLFFGSSIGELLVMVKYKHLLSKCFKLP